MKSLLAFICVLAMAISACDATTTAKPKLKLSADGLPSGHDTPEGVACDLARAFINRDTALFTSTCIKPFGEGKARDEYEKFLKTMTAQIKAEAAQKEPSPGGPKSIGKLFAARYLSHDGPASMGYAMFDWQEIMFVDVGVLLQNDKPALNRTAVIKDKDGKWYVDPAPTISSMLFQGLNDESPSKIDFTEAYEIVK